MQIVNLLFYGILAFGISAIAFLNSEIITINYYLGTKDVSVALFAIILLIIGILFGFISGFIKNLKLKFENRKLKQQLRLVEEELSKLRLLSVGDN